MSVDIPWLGKNLQYDAENEDWYDVDSGWTPDTVKGPWPIDEDDKDKEDDENDESPDDMDLPDDSDEPPDGFFPVPSIDIKPGFPLPPPLPGFPG